jgi:hypothetical protein
MEVPELPRVTLVGESVHVIPMVGDMAAVRLTVPVNPSRALAVIVDVPLAPVRSVTLVGLAETAKS